MQVDHGAETRQLHRREGGEDCNECRNQSLLEFSCRKICRTFPIYESPHGFAMLVITGASAEDRPTPFAEPWSQMVERRISIFT